MLDQHFSEMLDQQFFTNIVNIFRKMLTDISNQHLFWNVEPINFQHFSKLWSTFFQKDTPAFFQYFSKNADPTFQHFSDQYFSKNANPTFQHFSDNVGSVFWKIIKNWKMLWHLLRLRARVAASRAHSRETMVNSCGFYSLKWFYPAEDL